MNLFKNLFSKNKPNKKESKDHRYKIAFVVPWYGDDISGGAESECRGLVKGIIKNHSDKISVEVITTCLKEFAASWNKNYHQEGFKNENGVLVRRFNAQKKWRSKKFHQLNGEKLIPPVDEAIKKNPHKSPLTKREEQFYLDRMIHSKKMYKYLKKNISDYDYFIFMPYMFGTTLKGSSTVLKKAILIPCLHDERNAYLNQYRSMMSSVRSILFHVEAEKNLANRLYNLNKVSCKLLGEKVDTNPPKGNETRFRKKYHIDEPFILYAGRKIEGKNLPLLVEYFKKLKDQNSQNPNIKNLKLVILGKGNLTYNEKNLGIVDLGFVEEQDKFDAYRAAAFLCQPSVNESFSIVLMESWLQTTPVLVNGACEVTKDHCQMSSGGLAFNSYLDFQENALKLLSDNNYSKSLGINGNKYVKSHYTEEIVLNRLISFLKGLDSKNESKIPLTANPKNLSFQP